MGIDQNPTVVPGREHLREQARLLGVDVSEDDLTAVTGFLEAILPALAELEATLPASAAPVDPPAVAP